MREQTEQWGKALAIIAEFAAQSPETAKKADVIRLDLALEAQKAWAAEKSRLASDGTLDSQGNSRNWKKVYEATQRFLDSVEGLEVAAEVRAARDNAADHLQRLSGGTDAAPAPQPADAGSTPAAGEPAPDQAAGG
jgi:hypothetical protein